MAVVGNVGTYATVQPVQGPDFGGMVQSQFDKLDAERKAKARAEEEAKAKKQEELDKLTLPSLKTSNISEMNRQSEEKYKQMYSEYVEKVRAGDVNGARQLIASVGTLNNAVQFFNDKYKEVTSAEGKYNSQFLTEFEDVLRNINDANSDIEYKGNGLDVVTIYKDPEKKEVLVKGNLNEILNSINVPFKFDGDMLNKSIGSFVKTFKPDKIETIINKGSLYGTQSIEDSLNDPEINDELRRQAKNMVADRNTRAFYAQEKGMSLFQIDNFDETQKKEAEDYFYKTYKDALRKEIDLSIARKSEGGSGGSKSGGFNIVQSTLEIPKTYSLDNASVAYGTKNADGTSKTDVNMPAGSISFNVAKEGGVSIIVGDRKLNDIVYDPNSKKMIFALSTSASSRQGASSGGASAGEGESNKESSWFTERDLSFEQLKNSLNTIPSLRGRIKTKDDIVKYVLGIEEKKVDENL